MLRLPVELFLKWPKLRFGSRIMGLVSGVTKDSVEDVVSAGVSAGRVSSSATDSNPVCSKSSSCGDGAERNDICS